MLSLSGPEPSAAIRRVRQCVIACLDRNIRQRDRNTRVPPLCIGNHPAVRDPVDPEVLDAVLVTARAPWKGVVLTAVQAEIVNVTGLRNRFGCHESTRTLSWHLPRFRLSPLSTNFLKLLMSW